jgi:recombinational DNA repair protein (RecF pathway)
MHIQWKNNSFIFKNRQYLVNIEDNTLYSTSTYNLSNHIKRLFLSGIMMDLSSEQTTTMSSNSTFHEKKVRTLSYPALKEQTYDAKLSTCFVSKSLGAVGVNF